MTTNQCKSCGAEQTSRYCPECGEQRLNPSLRSATYVVKELFRELTEVDGKLWRTLRTLIFTPGQIDKDYATGRRRIYIKPITLFLIINVIFVMFATLSDFFVNYYSQRDWQPYSELTKPWLVDYVAQTGWTEKEFAERYDQLVKVLARSLIIIQVPFFALLMGILCYRRSLFSGDYLTFALSYHSWVLILFLIAEYTDKAADYINQTEVLPIKLTGILFYILFLGKIIYLSLAMRRMFDFSWINVIWRLPFAVAAYYVAHGVYRFIQLIITTSLIEAAPEQTVENESG